MSFYSNVTEQDLIILRKLAEQQKNQRAPEIKNKLENGTRRAQIPRKPLDPPISWIVTQSLIYITSYFLSNSKYVIYFCQDFVSSRRWILSIVNEKPFCNGFIMQMGKIENQQRTNTNVFTLTFI